MMTLGRVVTQRTHGHTHANGGGDRSEGGGRVGAFSGRWREAAGKAAGKGGLSGWGRRESGGLEISVGV